MHFRVKRTTQLGKLKISYSERINVPVFLLRYPQTLLMNLLVRPVKGMSSYFELGLQLIFMKFAGQSL
jgi:hypothetical protein